MEHDPRPFQAVNIGMTSVETGRERFFKDDYYHGPPLAAWRCNLTALSQRYNLYFIATREGVAVYQPEFPFQKLHQKPKLNIPPTLANLAAAGYIDEWRPHGINHLMVGDLGSEEILLVATDSGNVAAYHTRAIEEAINKDPYKFSEKGRSDIVGLRAFFSQWVHESAWGLAIHRQGRMVAVSANKPHHVAARDPSAKITVFAFALTSPSTDNEEDFEEPGLNTSGELQDWYDWDPDGSNGETPQRDRNFRITLGGDSGHINNIPSVSFINSQEDPDGSWLLSTDITGVMKLWRIWRGACHDSYDCEGTHLGIAIRRQRDAGWIVAALDPASFRPALSMDQFCGYHRPRSAPQYKGHPNESYDITNIVRLKTPGRSQKHPSMGEDSEDDDPPEEEEAIEQWTDEEIEEPDRKRDLILGLDSLRLPAGEDSCPPLSQTVAIPERMNAQVVDTMLSSIEATVTGTATPHDGLENNFITLDPVDDDSDSDEVEDQFDSEEEDESTSSGSPASHTSMSSTTQRTSVEVEPSPRVPTSPEPSGNSTRDPLKKLLKPSPATSKRQRDEPFSTNDIQIPTITALQCSQFHVRMLNIPKARSPHFFCANILTQDLPEAMERSNYAHLARLSMMQQIPELGIVIIASQLGRCAVCTLTKNVRNNAMGLRVDWILPTRRQERAGDRPSHPLLGIAVAPVQGRTFGNRDYEDTGGQDEEQQWARDQTVHGVKTTFDKSVLVLDRTARDHRDGGNSSDEEALRPHRTHSHRKHISKPKRKRIRPSPPATANANADTSTNPRGSLSSLSSQASTSIRPFPVTEQSDDWAAVESSRRYRLMLTYMDMTVLTYEIERGVEREDVRACESSRTGGMGVANQSGGGNGSSDMTDDDDDSGDDD